MTKKFLFKYRPISNEQQLKFVEDIVLHNKFFFAPTHFFFDPFEFKYKMDKDLVNPFEKVPKEKNIGILSLSEENNNITMWSYYADWHRGICMAFEFTNECPFFCRATKVEYLQNYPSDSQLKNYSDNISHSAIMHKPSFWAYEKEWRIIESGAGGEYRYYPKGKLSYIILGCMVKAEMINIIKKWIEQSDSKIQLKQTKVSANGYSLDIIDYVSL